MLPWNLNCAPVEVSEEWAEFFKMSCLITGIDCCEQKVSQIPETKKSLEDASLSSRRIQKVCLEAWGKSSKKW
jgi:hypothetical protein